MAFFERLIKQLESDYPRATSAFPFSEKLNSNLISSEVVRLNSSVASTVERIVSAFFALRRSKAWQIDALESISRTDSSGRRRAVAAVEPGNYSALMCYDFHLDADGALKLIEINTNASMGLISDSIYRAHALADHWSSDFKSVIASTFKEELAGAGRKSESARAAIIDENPETQKMYPEFLLYRDLLEDNGIRCVVADSRALRYDTTSKRLTDAHGVALDLIYNRDTDFYLETGNTTALRQAWLDGNVCVSPNSREYGLLADKERLLDLSLRLGPDPGGNTLCERYGLTPDQGALIADALLRVRDVSASDPQDLWDSRKKLFFKPKRMFGGKAAFRGSSISRTMFEETVLKGEFIAQEYVPAPSLDLTHGTYKYDLRFFAYRDRIQLGIARLYQGQTTNFQSPGGGVAAITFV